MLDFLQDLRYGARMLAKSPAYTAVAVLTLALGIGANTVVYTTARTFFLAPLPFLPEPDRLVRLLEVPPQRDDWAAGVAPGNFLDWRRQASAFEQVAACHHWNVNVAGSDQPERVQGFRATANYFAALGVAPALGRAFLPGEDRPGRADVAVLSDGLWRRRFGADPGIVGRTVLLNGRSHTVVGVMPPDVTYPEGGQIWAPLVLDAESAADRTNHTLLAFARLAPGVSVERARAELAAIAGRLAGEHPESNAGWRTDLKTIVEFQGRFARPFVFLLFAAVGLFLAIVCANVANLELARATVRERELAVRTALGAGRFRLFRQSLTESLLLAFLGGGLGVLAAEWGVALFRVAMPGEVVQYVPAWSALAVDRQALAYTALVTLGAGLAAGLAPALRAPVGDLVTRLKEGGRGAGGAARGSRLRRLLAVCEIAFALMLVASTGLMVRSFARLVSTDPGFETGRLLTLEVTLPPSEYGRGEEVAAFFTALDERVRGLPGVRGLALTNVVPLSGSEWTEEVEILGQAPAPGRERLPVGYRVVSNGFLATLGTPLLRGRSFGPADGPGAPRVAIVNDALARAYFPGADPLGRRLRIVGEAEPIEVVGLAGDVRSRQLDEPPRPEVYVPRLQAPVSTMSLLVRAAGDPAALAGPVQRQIAALDPALAAGDVLTFERLIAKTTAPSRLTTGMLAVFALLALLIAAIGIYGVISFGVAQRTHEIGVRVALGARRANVLALIVGQGAGLVLAGVVLGLAGALALTRTLAGLLYGVSPTDPLVFTAAATLLAAAALLASYLPARRAAEVDPIVALRQE